VLAHLIGANDSRERAWPLVITPGASFDFVCQTVNVAMIVNLYWRERGAASGELG